MPATITGFLDVQPTAALPREVEVEARADAALIKGPHAFPRGAVRAFEGACVTGCEQLVVFHRA